MAAQRFRISLALICFRNIWWVDRQMHWLLLSIWSRNLFISDRLRNVNDDADNMDDDNDDEGQDDGVRSPTCYSWICMWGIVKQSLNTPIDRIRITFPVASKSDQFVICGCDRIEMSNPTLAGSRSAISSSFTFLFFCKTSHSFQICEVKSWADVLS